MRNEGLLMKQETKQEHKEYEPIPLTATDKRQLKIVYTSGFMSLNTPITQLDLLQIRGYLKGKNDRLYEQLTRFIVAMDEKDGLKTDFERKLPRRKIHEQLS
jgi:hypothetical protein